MGKPYLDKTTESLANTNTRDGSFVTIGVTIVFHPDHKRIGDCAFLLDPKSNKSAVLNRAEPLFRRPDGSKTDALASSVISRKPIYIKALTDGAINITNTADGTKLVANKQLVEQSRDYSNAELDRGIVLELSNSVILLLHRIVPGYEKREIPTLIGDGSSMRQLRATIKKVADLDVPVLLLGETGVGKELVASAIHAGSKRADKPYVCVNMSAIPASLAASELFGHEKGAFTGATVSRAGYFAEAQGGTLFLDEVADTADEIQPMLLRAVDNKRVQPLGGKIREVDVRLIAATDSNLEIAVEKGMFRRPLLQRLAGYEIRVPPLRERREDIGLLFIHFLRQELEVIGKLHLLDESTSSKPWVPASLVAKLMHYDWPGNVRQLQNVTRQLVISNRDSDVLRIDPVVARLFEQPHEHARVDIKSDLDAQGDLTTDSDRQMEKDSDSDRRRSRRPIMLSDAEIIESLQRNQFNFNNTAAELNVSRTWLNTRVEHCQGIRKAKDIGADEIRRCAAECAGDLDAMAAWLQVSKRGLQLQMKRLNL